MITRETDYAIRALLRLALHGEDGVLSTTVLAEEMEIPYRFLRRILLKLVEEGFVTSTRGKHGGLRLAVSPADLSLFDIMQAMDTDSVMLNDCLADPDFCARSGRCVVHTALADIQETLRRQLSGITLAVLVAQERARIQTCNKEKH